MRQVLLIPAVQIGKQRHTKIMSLAQDLPGSERRSWGHVHPAFQLVCWELRIPLSHHICHAVSATVSQGWRQCIPFLLEASQESLLSPAAKHPFRGDTM